ncbi:MAG: amidophosphoribosyltransferase, partial [Fimbriiglobus sp.]
HPDRGQLIETYKELGPVAEAFRMSRPERHKEIMAEHAGRAAIGHVRYATCGPTGRSYAQPFERQHGNKWKWYAFAFNGNLANFQELKQEILALTEFHLSRGNDTEVIMHHLSHALRGDDRPDMAHVFADLSKKFDGAYNIAMLNAMGDMVVLRDPIGLRPMCYAIDGPVFAAASESVALLNLGFKAIKSLEPGEMVLIRDGKITFHRFAPKRNPAHCFFEWIYFANVASTLDDRSVYLSRAGLGKELARMERAVNLFDHHDGNTVVVPVPDTGKAAADAMAFELGIPSVEGLIRNRYIGRTFIEAGKEARADKVRQKFTPLRPVLEGKRVLLVEDSIVRSTTLKNLVRYVKEQGGATEVHVRVACPPIVAPCFYGIDMSTIGQLYAPKHMAGPTPTVGEQQEMAHDLGADTLLYLPLDAVARCIDLPDSHLCRACLTGDYPTEAGQRRYQLELATIAVPRRDLPAATGCGVPAVVGG